MRLQQDLAPYAQIEQHPLMEGRQMVMMLGAEKEVSAASAALSPSMPRRIGPPGVNTGQTTESKSSRCPS